MSQWTRRTPKLGWFHALPGQERSDSDFWEKKVTRGFCIVARATARARAGWQCHLSGCLTDTLRHLWYYMSHGLGSKTKTGEPLEWCQKQLFFSKKNTSRWKYCDPLFIMCELRGGYAIYREGWMETSNGEKPQKVCLSNFWGCTIATFHSTWDFIP